MPHKEVMKGLPSPSRKGDRGPKAITIVTQLVGERLIEGIVVHCSVNGNYEEIKTRVSRSNLFQERKIAFLRCLANINTDSSNAHFLNALYGSLCHVYGGPF